MKYLSVLIVLFLCSCVVSQNNTDDMDDIAIMRGENPFIGMKIPILGEMKKINYDNPQHDVDDKACYCPCSCEEYYNGLSRWSECEKLFDKDGKGRLYFIP